MAALDAVTIKVFGLNVADENGTTEFGSTAAGTTEYSDDPAIIQSAAWLEGWQDAVLAGTKRLPVLQDMNSVHYVTTYGLAYLQQEGIGVWLSDKEYRLNSIVKKDGTSQLFISLQNSNTNNALTEGAWWQQCGDLKYIPSVANATNSLFGSSILPDQITIANNSTDINNDIDFSAGNFQFSDGSGQAVATAQTKRLDASWAAGTNQGGLFSGSKANSTWYHCFAIYNPTSMVVDAGFDTSVTAANIPSGYTKYKRVGSIVTDGSGNIRGFTQAGNYFLFNTSIADLSLTSTGSVSSTNLTISSPLGVSVFALLRNSLTTASALSAVRLFANPVGLSALRLVGVAAASSSGQAESAGSFNIKTNTSSQIQYSISATSADVIILNDGWIDYQL